MKINKQKIIFYVVIILIIAAGGFYYWSVNSNNLPAGFAESNGRIEATEIDIATKTAGRIDSITVREGDFVKEGQVLAKMDTRALQEQLHEVQAQLRQAISNVSTAESGLVQRESEKLAAQAVVRQREAELDAAQKRLNRSRALVKTKAVSQQQVDDDTAQVQGARAALQAAKAQVAASIAAIDSAKAGVVQAKTRVDAATATERRIIADLDDSVLKAPRNGRIQYRVAEPGEVLGAGGRVLNMVDLSDVYMTFFLPTEDAGKVALGSDVHIVLDAAPNIVIPAKATFVASVAQFTPKTVETQNERLKLMFRVRARISPELLEKHLEYVKTGLPGKAYVRLDADAQWPTDLEVRLPQ
ncbi:HlyD family secretion protein [Providencia vermicola]|uniref:HlyD family efflux transporter periplasmic adaptor subunit n=3 Tax=Providencia TaxID=586 RepID=A0AAI9MW06_PROST|nr:MULTISPECIES: HlyD family efflux transporter periplasmic adaptor subunit [Providencia]ELR5044864.1 HlyD family efflux transporter periplasmic adaptor subunit [Providencia rettgeri]ELR5035471.1 HlyD family efflux transporter periplasmic adaptor subunit [Providencia stuartii]ELR5120005.1 HlyD family efflux transporter periplasmic adaptor subunit [Providencia stuartii]ELR5141761.1 HlyD family efflux transporter periplasmic adaptor subunit [Providencia stuartii]ELR5291112.1 HlyD family efflux t